MSPIMYLSETNLNIFQAQVDSLHCVECYLGSLTRENNVWKQANLTTNCIDMNNHIEPLPHALAELDDLVRQKKH